MKKIIIVFSIIAFIIIAFNVQKYQRLYEDKRHISLNLSTLPYEYKRIDIFLEKIGNDFCSDRGIMIDMANWIFPMAGITLLNESNADMCYLVLDDIKNDKFDAKKQSIVDEYNSLLKSDKLTNYQKQLSLIPFAKLKKYQIRYYINVYDNWTMSHEIYEEVNKELNHLADEYIKYSKKK